MLEPVDRPPPPPIKPSTLLIAAGAVVVGLTTAAGVYVDYRWFTGVAFTSVFAKLLWAKVLAGSVIGTLVATVLWANLRLSLRLSRREHPLHLYDPDGVPRVNLGHLAARFVTPVSLAIGVLSGLVNHVHWQTVLFAVHGTSFGRQDPIFGRDVGFYVFELPLLEALTGIGFWALGTTATACTAAYVMRGALSLNERGTSVSPPARVHLHIVSALLMGVVALETYLDVYHLLYSTMGPLTGASFADVHAKLPALRFKVAFAAIAAVLIAVNARREGFGLALLGGALFVTGVVAVAAYPAVVHRFSVEPNEFEKERVYLGYNIDATRAAYGLDAVQERALSGDVDLTARDIDNNHSTIDNVRLWDHRPLLDTFAQIQEIRTYYDFTSVHNDRYIIDGDLRQTMLSPRELSTNSLPNRTWVNERFTFTHGYGLTLGPVNEATPEGLPVLFVKDIPPVSQTPSIKVSQPAIYFGELSSDYVFVRTENREFDYPSGDGFVENDYDGKAGIRFDSTFMRLALALHLRSFKILLSNDIDSDSRVLMHRQPLARAQRILPFVQFAEAPYMIVRTNGSLMWILDGYLTTNRYPNAEPAGPAGSPNYIRNSVKVTVDAYDGTVTVYAADDRDPLLSTWRRIFPGVFKPLAEMPDDVRAHLRYPELIFRLQAEMFATYHMDEPQLIYNREDKWEVPSISNNDGVSKRMEPYYTVMKLPGETDAEFILMLPFTPSRKDNLSAWMVARADGDHFGELIVYRFPKDRLIFGPQQVVNRINQDAEISRQISLWDQRGSKAVFGTLLVIPLEESLIYVRPLYLQSEGGKIPELKRVIVAYEKRIAMKASLREALADLFGTPAAQAETAEPRRTSVPEAERPVDNPDEATSVPAVQALKHFQRAVKAQRDGDWAGYGRELTEVERFLRAMQPSAPSAPGPTPPPGTDAGVTP